MKTKRHLTKEHKAKIGLTNRIILKGRHLSPKTEFNVDENFHNNNLENLRILCYKCHLQLHGIGIKTRFRRN